MKRLLKTAAGLVCATIVMFSLNSTTLIASAATYPEDMQELLAEYGEEATAAEAVRSVDHSVTMSGYIVPLAADTEPPGTGVDPPGTSVVKVSVPSGMPKTGDDSNMGLFTIAALSSLLMLLCLLAKKGERDELQGS